MKKQRLILLVSLRKQQKILHLIKEWVNNSFIRIQFFHELAWNAPKTYWRLIVNSYFCSMLLPTDPGPLSLWCKIHLCSKHWKELRFRLGLYTFDGKDCNCPRILTKAKLMTSQSRIQLLVLFVWPTSLYHNWSSKVLSVA